MSFFKKLFGGSGGVPKTANKPVTYEGFTIIANPMREGSQYRIAAQIEKEIDGEIKTHSLIRADLLNGLDDANEASIGKAKQAIDEQGDRLFSHS